ncbi:ABC transporter ATP-binding protein [Pediococcus acidilactici]|nr:ABC transporter ATP-binding protein [Pediococcus acidilactici]MDO7803156.1 ABC transporter ATP-binding protein [Pediococcus acidilactici]
MALTTFGIYILISVVSSFLIALQMYINGKISNYLSFEVEYKVLNVVSSLKLSAFENEETYSQIDKLTNEAPTKPFEVFSTLSTITTASITLISSYIYIFKINTLYACALLLTAAISIPYLLYISKEQFSIHWERAEPERKNWYIKYIMTHDFSVKEVKFYNLSTYLKDKYKKLKRMFISQDLMLLKKFSLFNFIYEFTTSIISGVLVISVIWSIYIGKALIGTLTSVTQIISLTQENTQTIIGDIYSLKYDTMLLNKLFTFLSGENHGMTVQYADMNAGKKQLQRIDYLRATNLRFNYGDKNVLSNINFKISRGSLVAIVGKNGSGKSTLIKILAGLYDPESRGQLFFNDVDVLDYDKTTFHEKISILFQNFVKYEMSLKENIGFGDIKHINNNDEILAVKDKYASTLNKNLSLDSQMGSWFSNGTQISGGQWQGVATGRAFFNKQSDLVILDEPNSALDPIAEKKLFLEFKNFIQKDKIGLFISHRISTTKQADLILVIDDGEIIASGTHNYLEKNSKIYRELEEAEKYEE